MYSALALDREVVLCLLDDQERRLGPIKTQYPDVDRQVLEKPAKQQQNMQPNLKKEMHITTNHYQECPEYTLECV